jgi:hypothetical protein
MWFLGLGDTIKRHVRIKEEEDDDSELQLLASIVASNSSQESETSTLTPEASPTNFEEAHNPRILETRILIAMYNLRSAIKEIEATRLPGSTKNEQKKNLIVAVCSLESAMDNMADAALASRCLQMDDDLDNDVFDGSVLEDEEAEYNRLLCCLNAYEDELDAITITTEDSATARDKETYRILSELKEEESNLKHLMNMAVAIREMKEKEVGIDVVAFAPVLISGSDNEGRHQCLSAVAPVCRHCGGSHWKHRCPSKQSAQFLHDTDVAVERVEI